MAVIRRAEADERARQERRTAAEMHREWRERIDLYSAQMAQSGRDAQQRELDELECALPEVLEEDADEMEEAPSRSSEFEM